MCREHAPEAVAALVKALSNPRERVQAAEALLNRGFGRAPQVIEGVDGQPISLLALHLVAATASSAELMSELATRDGRPRQQPVIEGEAEPVDLLNAPPPLE